MEKEKIFLDALLENIAADTSQTRERIAKASEVLTGQLDSALAQTPYEVLHQVDRVKLKHYPPVGETTFKTPLLVTYALINRETMLDLQSDRSVVRTFQNGGIDLYMIDWDYPTRQDHLLTIDDHVNGYMNGMVNFIRRRCGVPKINMMGICMGGTFSVIYAALHPDKVKNLITTVTPTQFDTDKGLLHLWMKAIDADKMVDTFGNLSGDVMNLAFLLLNPARLIIDKYVGFLNQMSDRNFVENFVRMEKWIFDSPDIPGETLRQFIRDCYQKNLLIQSRMEVGGRRVDLQKITMPLLNFYGQYDHLVPPEACNQLTQKVGSRDVEDICLDTGHIGIYVSSKTQREFAPKILRWLRERDEFPLSAADRPRGEPREPQPAASPTKPVPASPRKIAAGKRRGKRTVSTQTPAER